MKTLSKQFIIKIVLLVLIILLLALLPIRASAAPAPSFTVAANPTILAEGEYTIIRVVITNTTGVDIMPTNCYANSQRQSVHCGFLLPGQSTTVDIYYTATFSGSRTEDVYVYLCYHEDGDFDTYTPAEKITLTNANYLNLITPTPEPITVEVITPAPPVFNPQLITAAPTETNTPTPVPTPKPTSAPTAKPTPASAPVSQSSQVSKSAGTVSTTMQPEATPSPVHEKSTEVPEDNEQEEIIPMYVGSDEDEPAEQDENIDLKIAHSRAKSQEYTQSETKLIDKLDGFTLFCMGLILVFGTVYLGLFIKLKINRKINNSKNN